MDQRSQQNPQKGKPPAADPMSKVRDLVTYITLLVTTITLFVYEWFGVGAEVKVGVGINEKIYYTAGYEHVGDFLLASVILIVVNFLIISLGSKGK
jgi:hypothetical protein